MPPVGPQRAPLPEHGQSLSTPLWRYGRWVLAAILLCLYLPSMARSATFDDGPDITTAIYTLGVIHPTGYPLITMLAHVFQRLCILPIQPHIKVELFNTICVLCGAMLTASAIRNTANTIRLRTYGYKREVELAALLGGFFLGVSPLVWVQVRVAEVYAFHILLVALAGWAWVRFDISGLDRYALLAALTMGCGLAHHVTMVYMLPPAAVLLLSRKPKVYISWLCRPLQWVWCKLRKRRPRRHWPSPLLLWTAVVLGLLPLLSYGYLIWANKHTAGLPWGGVDNFDHLYNHATGRQYHGFMGHGTFAEYFRRVKRIPDQFDQQMLPVGAVLLFLGVPTILRRYWRVGLFFLLYLLANIAHGVFYRVGDYLNYFLPAVYCCAVFIGIGFWWAMRWAMECPRILRRGTIVIAVGMTIGTGAVLVYWYATHGRRLPPILSVRGWIYVAVALAPFAAAAIGWGARLYALGELDNAPGRRALPMALTGCVLLLLVPATAARAHHISTKKMSGGAYGKEVTDTQPTGSIFMVMGDGYLFNMWYQQHVLERGREIAVIDIGNVRTPWYRDYLKSRHPRSCDPLSQRNLDDPKRYQRDCGTYAARKALGEKRTWITYGRRAGRPRPRPIKVDAPIVRGNDKACSDPAYRRGHQYAECGCFGLGKRRGSVEEYCVESFEDGGFVSLLVDEIHTHRIIEDMIDWRPVYEANVLTFHEGNIKKNPRGWSGPRHQRPSNVYALISRGYENQIVYRKDIAAIDPCASEKLVELPLRPLKKRAPYIGIRRLYEPNPHPTLFKNTFVMPVPDGDNDESSRQFSPGDGIYLFLKYAERHYYDPDKKDRRGKLVRHGLRFCIYGPDGRKVASMETVSNTKQGHPIGWQTKPDAPAGRYRLRGCSIGEVGKQKLPLPQRACKPTVLEFDFSIGEHQ